MAVVVEENERRSKELSTLRNRTTLSQQNWSKEREDLIRREAFAKEEFEAAKQAMQDWEVLAMEERSIRENIADRVADLEEQLSNHREAYEKAASERDAQSLTVDGLQRALQEIQDGTLLSPSLLDTLLIGVSKKQLGDVSFENWSRTPKHKLRAFKSNCVRQICEPPKPKHRWRLPREILSELFHSKEKSRKRIF